MYKQVETYKEIQLDNSLMVKPIATMEDEHGGICHIIEDDHCYLVCLKFRNGYRTTPYIFNEAFELLKTLPSLS